MEITEVVQCHDCGCICHEWTLQEELDNLIRDALGENVYWGDAPWTRSTTATVTRLEGEFRESHGKMQVL